MINVILLGDSIRMNYQDNVVKLLDGKANVMYPAENCRFAAYTLNSLRHWLPNMQNPDVIHWNNGIWDAVSCNGEDRPFSTLDEYMGYCKRILKVLKDTGAKVIFALTTPLKNNPANETIKQFNAAMAEYLASEGIEIDDLYSVIDADKDRLICEDNCHLSEDGKAAAAESVVKSIEKYL